MIVPKVVIILSANFPYHALLELFKEMKIHNGNKQLIIYSTYLHILCYPQLHDKETLRIIVNHNLCLQILINLLQYHFIHGRACMHLSVTIKLEIVQSITVVATGR